MQVESSCWLKSLILSSALLRQIGKVERYTVYVKSLQLTTRPEKSKQFIDDYLRATNKVVTSYRTEQSTATIFLQAEVYLKFTEVIFDLIFKLMAEPLDIKLFSQFASFCADYIACPTMQLDKLGTNQRWVSEKVLLNKF